MLVYIPLGTRGRDHCAIECDRTERCERCWMFRCSQRAGAPVFRTMRTVVVVANIFRRVSRPGFLIWNVHRPTSWSRFEILHKPLEPFKMLGADRWCVHWSLKNKMGFSTQFCECSWRSCRSNADSPCVLAHGRQRIASNGIPKANSIHYILSTTFSNVVVTFIMVHAVIDSVDKFARYLKTICDVTQFVLRTRRFGDELSYIMLKPCFEVHNNNRT